MPSPSTLSSYRPFLLFDVRRAIVGALVLGELRSISGPRTPCATDASLVVFSRNCRVPLPSQPFDPCVCVALSSLLRIADQGAHTMPSVHQIFFQRRWSALFSSGSRWKGRHSSPLSRSRCADLAASTCRVRPLSHLLLLALSSKSRSTTAAPPLKLRASTLSVLSLCKKTLTLSFCTWLRRKERHFDFFFFVCVEAEGSTRSAVSLDDGCNLSRPR